MKAYKGCRGIAPPIPNLSTNFAPQIAPSTPLYWMLGECWSVCFGEEKPSYLCRESNPTWTASTTDTKSACHSRTRFNLYVTVITTHGILMPVCSRIYMTPDEGNFSTPATMLVSVMTTRRVLRLWMDERVLRIYWISRREQPTRVLFGLGRGANNTSL
jgi:hypothetical protein